MTPVSLNPPPGNSPYHLSDQIQDQPLFISPNNQPSSSLSCRTFFNNILDQRQTRSQIGDLQRYQEGDKPVLHDGSSNYQAFSTSDQPVMDDLSNVYGHNPSLCKMEDEESKSSYGYGSSKWMSSKMRLMRKMMTPDSSASSNITPTFQNQQHAENSHRSPSNTTRVCSDCNTISTPLWRSGPKGPKSLCNACGIRQRKARRAMAEAAAAANGLVTSMDASSSTITKTRAHNKEKKSRTNHFAQFKNKSKSSGAGTSQGGRKLGFKDFAISFSNNSAFQQMFPRDEVAEAALLLMELSCGFVHI